jgi:hypothetical protein
MGRDLGGPPAEHRVTDLHDGPIDHDPDHRTASVTGMADPAEPAP